MELYPDFREFFESLKARDVRYLVIGGYALGYHGYVRYTGDIDAWVEPTPENSRRVIAAFHDFGFGVLGLGNDAFAADNVVVQIGRPPLRIDVLTSPSGVVFEDCYRERMVVDVDGLALDVIGLECLKANKAASGRPQDLADLSKLP
ncbi:DUF6036 family nucleotidyltransferase [Rubrivirga sp.]|uniref:DUF6036 family nucleotidyltransferase n=1 Tax=Rubrivirga sp. TaxID=1885344 RepID=UPI003C730A5E